MFSRHGVQRDWKATISGVHVSPGSAETLFRKSMITNHRLIACCLGNVSANNNWHWLTCIEVLVCNISVDFLETWCIAAMWEMKWKNGWLYAAQETSRRLLHFSVPRVVAVSPHMRLVEDNPASLSLLDIYKQVCIVTVIIIKITFLFKSRVREYVFYVFSDFNKHDFLRFFEMTYQKVLKYL